jgi:hypothetical protein
VTPLSADRERQHAALARLDAFGTTPHDSIARAIALIRKERSRRALILLSDGSDRYSATTASDALEQARRSDVMVYPIALAALSSPFFEQLAAHRRARSPS